MKVDIDPRYFDYAASSPVWKEALEAYIETSNIQYANPSSIHFYGKNAKRNLLELKKAFCDLVHFHDGRLLLCGSGSEANNTIVEGHRSTFPGAKMLMAEDVHESLWYATKKYHKSIEVLKIDHNGYLNKKDLLNALNKRPTLVCISHVCNETGMIHPVKDLAEMCFKSKTRLLIDGMQAIGHIPVDLGSIPFTYYTVSGHKFGAVKSTGGVLIRDAVFDPLVWGGKQQWNLRAGTEDVASLSSMVVALEKSIDDLEKESVRLLDLKMRIIAGLKHVSEIQVNSLDGTTPGILSISFPTKTGREIVGALSLSGFAISTGSACHANEIEPSRIIQAMGKSEKLARGTIRISMGRGTTEKSVNELVEHLLELTKN